MSHNPFTLIPIPKSKIQNPKSLRIGLTGPIGAGKSVVASRWEELGAGIVVGDSVGAEALILDADLRRALVERFGEGILSPGGRIDRLALGRVAFATPEGQRDLTAITFPALYNRAKDEMAFLAEFHDVVVFDAALLFEWGIERDFDRIVTVTAPVELLIERAAARPIGLTREDIVARLERQLPPDEKARRADIVIVNDGTEEDLIRKADDVFRTIGEGRRAESPEPKARY
ncbi:MAG: dephospho-CoA kinase [Calditrichaeota bacterium]|nr:dephospho-CoA kinase [Calditrichota bacterium]